MPEKKDPIDPLAQYPILAKVHAAYPDAPLTCAGPLILEGKEEIAKFMSEASMWIVATDYTSLSRIPALATTIHVAYWLTKLNDQQRIEKWVQAVEGLGEYVSSWQATLNSSN